MIRSTIVFGLYGTIALTIMASCSATQTNKLKQQNQGEGWIELFDGHTFKNWKSLGSDTIFSHSWKIEDGILKKEEHPHENIRADGQPFVGADLITVDSFENFELVFDWKIFKGGNSGLKYNVSEQMAALSGSKHSAIGFEYQLLDDADTLYAGKLKESQYTGSLYDLLPPQNKPQAVPIEGFNSSRIIVTGDSVEHWLNGTKILSYQFGSTLLEQAFQQSKFIKIDGFHHKRKGHIVLQDHNSAVWFKNIKLRVL